MYTEEHFWAYKMLNFKAVWLQQKKATVLHCIINQKVFKISFFLKKIITHLIHSGGKNRYFLCTRTHRHTSIKSFGLSQQELHFDVCHIRQGPRLEIKQTPPLSLHLDIPAAELQLADFHTKSPPERHFNTTAETRDIVGAYQNK